MIVRNWMSESPTIVNGDMLVSEVKRLLVENNLRAVPVVDDGVLRGLISRASCLRAAENATRNQDQHEINYFVTQLKVKDLMVRHPATVDASDTMAHCLKVGQETGVSQFPVMDNGKVVGLIGASEVFSLAARMLGAWHDWHGVTLDSCEIKAGTLAAVAQSVETTGARVQSLFTIGEGDSPDDCRKILIRFRDAALDEVVAALESNGYTVLEAADEVQSSREAVGQ